MNSRELEIVGRYFEKEMIEWAFKYYYKKPNQITIQDFLDQPDTIENYSAKVFAFEEFFTSEYESDEILSNSLFNTYKIARKRIHFVDYMQLLTACRGTNPRDRAFKIYTLRYYRRVIAAIKKGKVAYAAVLTAKGPGEWISPLIPYYFIRAYVCYRFYVMSVSRLR